MLTAGCAVGVGYVLKVGYLDQDMAVTVAIPVIPLYVLYMWLQVLPGFPVHGISYLCVGVVSSLGRDGAGPLLVFVVAFHYFAFILLCE